MTKKGRAAFTKSRRHFGAELTSRAQSRVVERV